MNFQIGDRVIIIRCYNRPWAVGWTGTVVGDSGQAKVLRDWPTGGIDWAYPVEWDGLGLIDAHPKAIKKINDDDEKTSWEDCVWKPKELVKVNA
jgi:hypothetical protein